MPPGTCRTYWVEGSCRFGAGCRYKHDQAREAGADKGADGDAPKGRVPQHVYLAGMPPGACRTYWMEGGCAYGAGCRYRHNQVRPGVQPRVEVGRTPAALTDEDLTALASGGTSDVVVGRSGGSGRFQRDHLYRWLARDGPGQFSGTADMYRFVETLLLSSKESTSWVSRV